MAEWQPTEFRDLDDVEAGTPDEGDVWAWDGSSKLVPGHVRPDQLDVSGSTGPNQVVLTDGIGGAAWDDPPFVPGPASAITVADAAGDFDATNVEDALAELQADHEADAAALAAHLADTSDAHDASAVSFVPTGTIAASNVQDAIAEVAAEGGASSAGVQANLDAHIADTTDAHDASAISILDAANDFTATNVEAALAELQSDHEADAAALAAHLADTSDAHDASAISIVDAAGDFTATDVEGALAELQADHEADEAALAAHLADTGDAHDASAISVVPTGTIAATDAQAAIAELHGDDVAIAAAAAAGDSALDAAKADKATQIIAGAALTGGGTLAADRTLDVAVDGSTIEVSGDALRVKDGGITDDKLNSEAAPIGHIATADGLGGVSYEAPAAAPAGASGTFFWDFDDPTSTPPASGTFRLDDTPQEDALAVYFHETDADGVSRLLWLGLLGKGDRVVISQEDDATKFVTYDVTDPPTDNGAYWTVPVEVFSVGGALVDGERCGVTFLLGAGGGSGETILREIEQTAHGLSVGDWIRLDSSGDYVLAQADSAANAEVLGVVVDSDPNVFVFVLFGWLDAVDYPGALSGLTPGETYFLSDTVAGAIEAAPGPLSPTTVSKPVLTAATATSGWVRELRGMLNEDPAAATPFTREERSSDTTLAVADKGKTIAYTTGGFTQTLDDAAVLGDGWWILLHNTTVAPVTLDGDAGDTIDGAVTRVLLPGEVRMLLCDGSNFVTVGIEEPYPWTTIRKAADESLNTNTTPQDDNELQFATVSGAIYEIELVVIYASPVGAGTPDLVVRLGEDNTARGVSTFQGRGNTDATAFVSALTAQNVAFATAGTAAGNRAIRMTAIYEGGGGTFKLQWAQGTSNANDVTVRAGSILRYRRIL